MTVLREDPSLIPLCPHCKAELNEVVGREMSVTGTSSFAFGKRYIYACPRCHKAIGITHRKGFWAG